MDWKAIVQKMVRKIGYEVHRTGIRGEYTWCYAYDYWIYYQWSEDWFQESYDRIRDRPLGSGKR